jgi:hypothetical protein
VSNESVKNKKLNKIEDTRGYISVDRATALKANFELIKHMIRPANTTTTAELPKVNFTKSEPKSKKK